MAKTVSFIINEKGHVVGKVPQKVTVQYIDTKELIEEFEPDFFIEGTRGNQRIDGEENVRKYGNLKLILEGKGFILDETSFNPKYRFAVDYAVKGSGGGSVFKAEKDGIVVDIRVDGDCEVYVFNDETFFKDLKDRVDFDTYNFLEKAFYYIVEERMNTDNVLLEDTLDIISVLQDYVDISKETLSVIRGMLEKNDYTDSYEEDIHLEKLPLSFLAGFRKFTSNNWVEIFAYKKDSILPMDGELDEDDDVLSAIEGIEDTFQRFLLESDTEETSAFERFLNTEHTSIPKIDYDDFL